MTIYYFHVNTYDFFLVEKEKVKKEKHHEELNELQYKRVDIILSELVKQFPVRAVADKVVKSTK